MRAYNFLLSPKMAEVPVLTLCLSLVLCAFANPEQGKWTFTLDQVGKEDVVGLQRGALIMLSLGSPSTVAV